MMIGAVSCLACRAIRRFLFAFAVGGFLAWQFTGSLPFQGDDAAVWQGLMAVAIMFTFLSVFMRMREMRARFRR